MEHRHQREREKAYGQLQTTTNQIKMGNRLTYFVLMM
jgi:hypothetical protein